ncbi:Copper resistance protein B OS=Eoetvoesiella caeni OX=645616 GN=DFR37_11668 PE=4 SV=1 [Eoetvoesiella caeni]|mgnify:FL=1|uniref:Copper resistance protein B n=3 Tax=Alcaligenaceae TaxID=506 RepID=A0A366H258_9BURK|nr:copper resistance protein B [Pollutimonas bauzanensis]NYT56831.1 copper resistance protein B [Eoetvoesiella caeni]RBP35631.1 copper resistance protein B [Eoetvoesiella caeni]SHI53944.1 copper resistance protein B [Pollutimonas bauzanensis]
MNTPIKKRILALAIATLGATPLFAYAQAHDAHSGHTAMSASSASAVDAASMPGMDHSKMNMPGMDHGAMNMGVQDSGAMNTNSTSAPKPPEAMPGMNHGQDNTAPTAPAHDMGAMGQGSGEMDHGTMQMQGGTAPPDARDPNAYSDGYTLDSGKYSLGPAQRLRMSDEHNFGSVWFDRLEYVRAGSNEGLAYEGQAWYGGTYNRAVLKAEGEVANGKLQESQTELLWGHAISTFWDTQLGIRFDHGQGVPNRKWLAFGVQGLAPYWFDIDATAYVGPSGRTALSLSAEYDLLITQRLVLQPRVEVNFYGKRDEAREIGSGLSDGTAGLRLKYQVTRQFVPYVGVEWTGKFGQTATFARDAGERARETRFVAGLSFRF